MFRRTIGEARIAIIETDPNAMTYGLEILFAGKTGQTRTARVIRGSLLAAAAVFVSVAFVVLTRRAMQTSLWQPTPCRVVDSSVDVSDVASDSPYTFSIRYEFDTPNGPVSCDKLGGSTPRGRDAAEIYAMVRQWPVGLRTTCYVNPADRQKAVLIRPNVLMWQAVTAFTIALSLLLIIVYCIPQLMPPRPAAAKNRGVELFYLALWTAACAAAFYWITLAPLVRNESALHWSAVPCTIEHARVTREELHGELPLTPYRTDALYRYTVAGVEYHSNRYSLTELASPFASGRQNRVDELAAQPESHCYVDPTDPEQAVLTHRVSPTQGIGAWVGLLFAVGLYTLIPRRRRARLDAALRRSRWTIGSALMLLLVATIVGWVVMP